MTGVGHRDLGPLFANMLKLQGKRGLIVHSTDGLDEISVCAPTDVWEAVGTDGGDIAIKTYTIAPSDFGLPTHHLDDISGGTAEERVRPRG